MAPRSRQIAKAALNIRPKRTSQTFAVFMNPKRSCNFIDDGQRENLNKLTNNLFRNIMERKDSSRLIANNENFRKSDGI